jgi:hypothetical protein
MVRRLTDTVQLSKIRIRESTRKALAREAERNQRTLNAEIAERLSASISKDLKEANDGAVVATLAGPDKFNAELLRWITYEIQATKPGWWASRERIDDLAARLSDVVREVASPVSPKSGHRHHRENDQ